MTTFTSSLATAGAPVKRNSAGQNAVRVAMAVVGATLSDILLLAKVPNGALITEMKGVIGSGNTDSVIKLGWRRHSDGGGGSETAFGTHTVSSTDAVSNFINTTDDIGAVHISFTDTLGSDYAEIFATCSTGSFTDTFSMDVALAYHLDHNEGQGS